MTDLPQRPDLLQKLVAAWSTRPAASVAPRHDGGVTLRSGIEEIGHLHHDGTLHLAFPRPMRDALVRAGAVDPHPAMPDSGWVTYRIRGSAGLEAALDLLGRAETSLREASAARDAAGSRSQDRQVDEAVKESFPASDPPATGSTT